MNKMMCGNRRCGWVGDSSELLTAPSPFDATDIIRACPRCKDVDTSIHTACEFEDCRRYGEGGYPLKDGRYVWRCHDHAPEDGE